MAGTAVAATWEGDAVSERSERTKGTESVPARTKSVAVTR